MVGRCISFRSFVFAPGLPWPVLRGHILTRIKTEQVESEKRSKQSKGTQMLFFFSFVRSLCLYPVLQKTRFNKSRHYEAKFERFKTKSQAIANEGKQQTRSIIRYMKTFQFVFAKTCFRNRAKQVSMKMKVQREYRRSNTSKVRECFSVCLYLHVVFRSF